MGLKPFVHVNCAMSADGKIAGCDRRQVRISSGEDMERVKTLRRTYDAILVGVGTVLADDPHLTVKGLGYEENPLRIVLDPDGRTPDGALVLDGRAGTVIVTSGTCTRQWNNAVHIRSGNRIDLPEVIHDLAHMGIESILVEGGGETIASFFRHGLVDRYTVFVGGLVIGGRSAPTPADGDGWVRENGVPMRLVSSETLGNGVLLTFEPHSSCSITNLK
jgi:2,5-diamino-6-(ribosylamino)-4(3H)-pyrimidinone 5'-phosphate reductase